MPTSYSYGLRKTFDGLDGTKLKIIAMLSMLIDHMGASLILDIPSSHIANSPMYILYWLMRLSGRLAFPIYAFLLVEGISHTKSKPRYVLRMLIFAILSEFPYDLLFNGTLIEWEDQNVIVTLLIATLVLWGYTYTRETGYKKLPQLAVKIVYLLLPAVYFAYRAENYITKSSNLQLNKFVLGCIIWVGIEFVMIYFMNRFYRFHGQDAAIRLCADIIILAAGMGVADLLKTDYSSAGILTISIMYAFRNNIQYSLLSGCFALTALTSTLELPCFCSIPIVMMYNGKRGKGNKYLFYSFYPVHLAILFALHKLFEGMAVF